MIFQILSSSSAGNAALIETAQTRVLVDAGLSGRQLVGLLDQAGKPIETVQAVFLTHEHGDHTAGLRGLGRYPHLQFFATHGTAQAAMAKSNRSLKWRIFEPGSSFTFADLRVDTCLVPHDALEPVGYVFRYGGEDLFTPAQSVAILTDLGHIPPRMAERIRDVQLLLIESNHCPDLLEEDLKRPWSVKQRIRGRHGHLSNDSVRDFLQSVPQPLWRRILLGHLSRDCNSPERALATVAGSSCQWPVECLSPHQLLFEPIDLTSL